MQRCSVSVNSRLTFARTLSSKEFRLCVHILPALAAFIHRASAAPVASPPSKQCIGRRRGLYPIPPSGGTPCSKKKVAVVCSSPPFSSSSLAVHCMASSTVSVSLSAAAAAPVVVSPRQSHRADGDVFVSDISRDDYHQQQQFTHEHERQPPSKPTSGGVGDDVVIEVPIGSPVLSSVVIATGGATATPPLSATKPTIEKNGGTGATAPASSFPRQQDGSHGGVANFAASPPFNSILGPDTSQTSSFSSSSFSAFELDALMAVGSDIHECVHFRTPNIAPRNGRRSGAAEPQKSGGTTSKHNNNTTTTTTTTTGSERSSHNVATFLRATSVEHSGAAPSSVAGGMGNPLKGHPPPPTFSESGHDVDEKKLTAVGLSIGGHGDGRLSPFVDGGDDQPQPPHHNLRRRRSSVNSTFSDAQGDLCVNVSSIPNHVLFGTAEQSKGPRHRRKSSEVDAGPADKAMEGVAATETDFRESHEENIFDMFVFAFEAVTQYFPPILWPIVVAVQGIQSAQNKLFLPTCSLQGIRFFLINLRYTVPTAYCLAATSGTEAIWAIPVAVAVASFNLYRVVCIAGKYACFSPQFYQHFISTPFNVMETNLITTWMEPSQDTIRRELRLAQRRAMCNLENDELVFRNGTSVNALPYMKRLISTIWMEKTPAVATVLITLFGLITASFPIVVYVMHFDVLAMATSGRPLTLQQYIDLSICITAVVSLFGNCPASLYFAYIGYLNASRHLRTQQALFRAIIRTRANIRPDPYMFHLHWEKNLDVFFRMTNVARLFGRVYNNRLSFCLFALAATVGMLVLFLLQQSIWSATVVLDRSLVALIALFILCCGGTSVSTIVIGSLINKLDKRIEELLLHERHEMLSCAEAFRDEAPLIEQFGAAAMAIKARAAVDPFVVMYAPARPELLTGFISAMAAGLLLAINVMVRGTYT